MSADETGSELSILTVTADDTLAADLDRRLGTPRDITVTTAHTAAEAISALTGDRRIDGVVSDHELPDTDGLALLEIVRAQSPTLPFVLVVGEDAEGVASDAVAAGVTEYFVRGRDDDQWDRLAELLTTAVSYHRTQRPLVDVEERAQTYLDAADDVIAVVRDGRFDYLNETGREYLGVETSAAMRGEPVEGTVTVEGEPSLETLLAAVADGDRCHAHAGGTLAGSDGTAFLVEMTLARIEWADGPAVVLVLRDQGDERQRERALAVRNRVIDEAPVGITIADATATDHPLVYANEAFQRLTGYDEADIVGHNARFLQGENTDSYHTTQLREGIARDEPVTTELRNYRKDGTEFWNRTTVAPIRNDAGDVTNYVGFQEDVTGRKENEDLLRRFRRAVEAAGHAIYMTDPEGTITYVNPSFERITGYDAETAIGETPALLNSGEMGEEYYQELWETISAGDVWAEEIRDRRQSGELYYADQTIAPLTDGRGEIEAYVAIQTDVTERKEREAQLRQYERAIEGASESIAAVDDDYRFLFANRAYREVHDIEADDITSRSLSDVVGEDLFETAEPYVERAFDGHTVQYRMTRTRPDRADRTFDIRYYPLVDESGDVWAVVATMRDLTEQVERERQLASLDRLLRHNINNELNVIDGRADVLLDRADDDIAELARPIQESARRVLDQADKHREIVELLSAPSTLTTLNLATAVEGVVATIASKHPAAEITVDVPPIELTTVPAVERAIEELVENAIVHSDRQTPEVRITAECRDESTLLSVADNGTGIPPNERQVITRDDGIEPLSHSVGMGLWLVKRIANRANGTLQFDDGDAGGSVVRLVLPRDGRANLELA